MKKFLAAAVFATLIGSPAFAQSYDPSVGSGNIVPHAAAAAPRGAIERGAFGAYARVPHAAPAVGQSFGQYGGVTDPDPNIQLQLYRESLRGRW